MVRCWIYKLTLSIRIIYDISRLVEKLQTLEEDQLEQDVEIVGYCIQDEYYDIDIGLDDDSYTVQIKLT